MSKLCEYWCPVTHNVIGLGTTDEEAILNAATYGRRIAIYGSAVEIALYVDPERLSRDVAIHVLDKRSKSVELDQDSAQENLYVRCLAPDYDADTTASMIALLLSDALPAVELARKLHDAQSVLGQLTAEDTFEVGCLYQKADTIDGLARLLARHPEVEVEAQSCG